MSVTTIGMNPLHYAEAAKTYEPKWNPEDISSEEAERLETELDAWIVAQHDKGPLSPAAQRIYEQIVNKSRLEELKCETQTKRTYVPFEWDSDSEESDPKR